MRTSREAGASVQAGTRPEPEPEAETAPPPGSEPESGAVALPRVVYSAETIAGRVQDLGEELTRHYRTSDRLLVLGLLKGSFIFMADLVRRIRLPVQVDFLIAASYGSSRVSSGEVKLLYDPVVDVRGCDVLLVEDIVDSGVTLDSLTRLMRARGPASLETCALLHKRAVTLSVEPKWVGFDAPPEFLVGYGLDHDERFRHLPYIGSL